MIRFLFFFFFLFFFSKKKQKKTVKLARGRQTLLQLVEAKKKKASIPSSPSPQIPPTPFFNLVSLTIFIAYKDSPNFLARFLCSTLLGGLFPPSSIVFPNSFPTLNPLTLDTKKKKKKKKGNSSKMRDSVCTLRFLPPPPLPFRTVATDRPFFSDFFEKCLLSQRRLHLSTSLLKR